MSNSPWVPNCISPTNDAKSSKLLATTATPCKILLCAIPSHSGPLKIVILPQIKITSLQRNYQNKGYVFIWPLTYSPTACSSTSKFQSPQVGLWQNNITCGSLVKSFCTSFSAAFSLISSSTNLSPYRNIGIHQKCVSNARRSWCLASLFKSHFWVDGIFWNFYLKTEIELKLFEFTEKKQLKSCVWDILMSRRYPGFQDLSSMAAPLGSESGSTCWCALRATFLNSVC